MSLGAFSGVRSSLGRLVYGSPLYGVVLAGRTPAAPHFLPPAPFAGSIVRGAALIEGWLLPEAGLPVRERVEWLPPDASPALLQSLHGFSWLADLKAVGGAIARARARALVADHLAAFNLWHEQVWAPDILGQRIYQVLACYEFFAASADDALRTRCLAALSRQARHLARALPQGTGGIGLIGALKALAVAGLAFTGFEAWTERALRLLVRELERQLLPDGGHASRSPSAQLGLLRHLIELGAALRAAGHEPPPQLSAAIDATALTLRSVRHGDGRLGVFNGGGEEDAAAIEQALARAHPQGRAPAAAPDWGYDRMGAARTLLIVDGGRPPAAEFAAAGAGGGALSLELSLGRERLIVNPGGGAAGAAVHSTLTIDGVAAAPGAIERIRRERDGQIWLDLAQDGFRAACGLTHQRRLYLTARGDEVRGEDTLRRAGSSRAHAESCTLRFHLHPEVRAALVGHGNALLLRLPSGAGFRLKCLGGALSLEESVYGGADGPPRRAQQAVLTAKLGGTGAPGETVARIRWTLSRLAKDSASHSVQ